MRQLQALTAILSTVSLMVVTSALLYEIHHPCEDCEAWLREPTPKQEIIIRWQFDDRQPVCWEPSTDAEIEAATGEPIDLTPQP